MATTYASFDPLSAVPVGTNYPQLMKDGKGRPMLAFDGTTSETCEWSWIIPQGMTGAMTWILSMQVAATTGALVFAGSVEAVTPADALNLNTTDSFDTANNSASTTVPGTTYYSFTISITMTNADSYAAGDRVRFRVARLPADAGDTMSGDAYLAGVEVRI